MMREFLPAYMGLDNARSQAERKLIAKIVERISSTTQVFASPQVWIVPRVPAIRLGTRRDAAPAQSLEGRSARPLLCTIDYCFGSRIVGVGHGVSFSFLGWLRWWNSLQTCQNVWSGRARQRLWENMPRPSETCLCGQ
jgi:hypothetical protein